MIIENKMTDAVKVEIVEFPIGSVSKHKLCMTDKNGNTITANLSSSHSDIKDLAEALRKAINLGSDMKISMSFMLEKE